ncbi:cytosolic phospholipase A2-like [Uloborus diversus]|uniref:cytosolic phospholipase A2-like n=1 Tax=Uloborus diversus TaxID=327109 RepID=UPI00240A9BFD|nr:cytosolic phospholipase A2-like [Uloborus diversus]
MQSVIHENFYIFQVSPDPCHVLNVTVLDAHKITKGWIRDFVDKPDPYIILRIPGSSNGRKRTAHFNNVSSPTWNENFSFILDPEKVYELEITLMDANYTVDGVLGCEKINLESLVLDEECLITLKFGKVTELNLKLLLTVNNNPDLRYGLCLSEREKEFRKHRQKIVMNALKDMFANNYPEEDNEVPTVGIVASGGGFRALVGFHGVMKALYETKLIDCITYIASLSGSSWYLSTLYSHPEFPEKSPTDLLEEFKRSVCRSPFWLLSPNSMYRYISTIRAKYKNGQPVSFTDFFGHLLGDTLLKDRIDTRLSDQVKNLEDAKVPMPLYSCLHVKSNVSAKVFQDWIEFTPYEIGISKYATFMKAEQFGSKFFKGHLMKEFPEFPLHYLQGVWGSAFSILFKRLFQKSTQLSLDLDNYFTEESDDEEEIFYDAEDYLDDEDILREAFEGLDLDQEEGYDIQSESEEDLDEKSDKEGSSDITKEGFWLQFINNISTCPALDTRKGRAGRILNPLRGLSLIPCFPHSPVSPTKPRDDTLFKGLTEPASTNKKTLYLVDGGLNFNLPFPLLLRPQRTVDMYLTFDFSSRESDNKAPFKELLLSEKWAELNDCLFPPIKEIAAEYLKQPSKECYVFKHPTNELCPIVLHFPLCNLNFRKFKEPGVPRESAEELEFADFNIFGGEQRKAYSTFNFKYPPKQFDRLSQLMEFNVLNNLDIIKENLDLIVSSKKQDTFQLNISMQETDRSTHSQYCVLL